MFKENSYPTMLPASNNTEGTAEVVTGSPSGHSPKNDSALQGVSDRVLRYFREFLETDFKRQQAPRRRIQLKTQAGFRAAIDLRKYPSFFKDAWTLMQAPPQEMKLSIGRRKYKAQLSPVLRNLVEQFAKQLPDTEFDNVRKALVRAAVAQRQQYADNAEEYVEKLLSEFSEKTSAYVVHPLLSLLEGSFKEAAYSAEDSIFEIGPDLTDTLCASAAEHLPQAINTVLLTGDTTEVERVLTEFFDGDTIRAQVIEFFESYIAADVVQELRDVLNFTQSDDTLTTYLYFGAVKFGPNDYPLFYLPVTLTLQEEGGYEMLVDPRLFIHKQAIEFIVSEMRQQAERVSTAVIAERILHLGEGSTASGKMISTINRLQRTFDVASDLDFADHRPQVARSAQVRISNAVYLAAFDRSDESLVNDYEALLSSLDVDHQAASSMFQGIVKSMLFEEPTSVSASVRDEWQGLSTSRRLVTHSPIPLNEEQIRIDAARRKPNCRFIAVEGPPGTGKSHTITALAFNAIMDHQSVLIISDKNEALEVVQDKLEGALKAVRHGDGFPNPILRLGKDGTYRSLISGSSRVKIQNHYQAQQANMPQLEKELHDKTQELSRQIDRTVEIMSSVKMADIDRLYTLEHSLEERRTGLTTILQALSSGGINEGLASAWSNWPTTHQSALAARLGSAKNMTELWELTKVHALSAEVAQNMTPLQRQSMALFNPMQASKSAELMGFIARIKALKMPLFGYLFRGGALAALDAEIAKSMPSPNPLGLSKKVEALEAVAVAMGHMGSVAQRMNIGDELTDEAYALLLRQDGTIPGVWEVSKVLSEIHSLLQNSAAQDVLTATGLNNLLTVAYEIAEFMILFGQLNKSFNSIPQIKFVSDKARLEALNTARLAHRLDSRFLEFAENNRATAQALGGVIKQRAQFPTDQFKTLRDAFPCVIAGIRELGEFVPLKTEVFDLLIIDEGSQVSVAQAMPAMLRAKQVVVFGDRKQFSNVKSHNASNATNASYMSDLKDHFRSHVSHAVDKIDRLQRFDVKRSVLDFVDLVANHTEMLRKHFRGYPELISYSSKNFYNGALQAIKVRPVPIDQVLAFDVIQNVTSTTDKRNINQAEAVRILEMLTEMVQKDNLQSVGIITPHAEQAAYISGLVVRHHLGQQFDDRLKLKVMSFDSCQGEERDVIIYSMVATRDRDVLNYVFPVELKTNEDENDNMKAQRLNVGFSRAKEKMIFVCSKEPEEFRGSIGQALMHYKSILTDRTQAEEGDTDANSPMEKKLLNWLKSTSFMQQQSPAIELIAQFPVGDYLKQLDATYKHPSYKVDFLLRHFNHETGKLSNIVIEYDGFEYHFVNRNKVTSANYEWYYRPEDIERQFVLESYGYRFLRVNRFNLGDDPVATLDQRLREMIDVPKTLFAGHAAGAASGAWVGRGSAAGAGVSAQSVEGTGTTIGPTIITGTPAPARELSIVDKIKEEARALETKEAKTCQKCNVVKDKNDFFDLALGSGKGGYGRICMSCKKPSGKSR